MHTDASEDITEVLAHPVAGHRSLANRFSPIRRWWHEVSTHLPAVLLLTLLTAAVHPLDLLGSLDGFMMRWITHWRDRAC